MTAAPPILTRLTARLRAPAFTGLLAVALLHVYAATHQFEHAADHDPGGCQTCAAYSQLDDSVVPSAPGESILVAPDTAATLPLAGLGEDSFAAIYQSRAPPFS